MKHYVALVVLCVLTTLVRAGVIYDQTPVPLSSILAFPSAVNTVNNRRSRTVTATVAPGYAFNRGTSDSVPTSSANNFALTLDDSYTLVANFIPIVGITNTAPDTLDLAWPASPAGWVLLESSNLSSGSWIDSTREIAVINGQNQVSLPPSDSRRFFRLRYP